ncbi:unnamed protein product [Arctogadus glacialis]
MSCCHAVTTATTEAPAANEWPGWRGAGGWETVYILEGACSRGLVSARLRTTEEEEEEEEANVNASGCTWNLRPTALQRGTKRGLAMETYGNGSYTTGGTPITTKTRSFKSHLRHPDETPGHTGRPEGMAGGWRVRQTSTDAVQYEILG